MNHRFDTIAAIATPSGPGGIGIVRLSGSGVLSILDPLFVSPAGRTAHTLHPRHMHYGFILDTQGERLDEVLVVSMPGPHSATGEDVVEIHCHGGPAITAAILEAVLSKGARLAEPGEFTRRAFLSGRIDLAQAEAVAEAIAAPTKEGVRLAQAKMSGALSQMVQELRTVVDTLRMQFAAALDFPDEEEEIVPQNAIMEQVHFVKERLKTAIAGYERARLWREGASIVLIGQVNVGKSSLLNALLGRERAIVSDTPGTTRDYIEETLLIGGMPLRCVDTAGLRLSADHIEEEGMRRALQLADDADVIVLVVDSIAVADSSRCAMVFEEDSPELSFLSERKKQFGAHNTIIVVNKSDIDEAHTSKVVGLLEKAHSLPVCAVSAKQAQGLDSLTKTIENLLLGYQEKLDTDIAPNLRQTTLLQLALAEMTHLGEEVEALLPLDIVSLRLDAVAQSLGDVIGVSSTDDLLGTIFSSFCIGK